MPTIPTILPTDIAEKYTTSGNTFVLMAKDDPKDRIEAEIGDITIPNGFLPQVKIKRWDNEVNLSVRLINNENNPKVVTEEGKIKWQGKKIDAHFYDLTEGEGGYEFEVILKEKPLTNKIEFSLNTKGLDFFYQPPLTEEFKNGYSDEFKKEIVVTETQVKDLEGNILVERPEKWVGSWVAYHNGNPTNYVGGKLYRTGQTGVFFRPKITDVNGKWAWEELKIENGILTITIPQEFLDKAVYPIRSKGVNFGYETEGASRTNFVNDTIRISSTWAGGNGTVEKITAFIYCVFGQTTTNRAVIYKNSDNSLVTFSAETSFSPAVNAVSEWKIFDVVDVSISATNYDIGFWLNPTGANLYINYNSGARSLRKDLTAYHATNDPPSSFTEASVLSNYIFSIYATYTAAGGETESDVAATKTNLAFMGIG